MVYDFVGSPLVNIVLRISRRFGFAHCSQVNEPLVTVTGIVMPLFVMLSCRSSPTIVGTQITACDSPAALAAAVNSAWQEGAGGSTGTIPQLFVGSRATPFTMRSSSIYPL